MDVAELVISILSLAATVVLGAAAWVIAVQGARSQGRNERHNYVVVLEAWAKAEGLRLLSDEIRFDPVERVSSILLIADAVVMRFQPGSIGNLTDRQLQAVGAAKASDRAEMLQDFELERQFVYSVWVESAQRGAKLADELAVTYIQDQAE